MIQSHRSLGVTLFAFIFGRLPFMAKSVHLIYDSIVNQPLILPDNVPIDENLKALLFRLLDKNPLTRIAIADLKNDSWVTENGKWKSHQNFNNNKSSDNKSTQVSLYATDDSTTFETYPVTVTNQEVNSALTLVNRVILVVRLKNKMKRDRKSVV